MNNIESLIKNLKEQQINALLEAHQYTYSQFQTLGLIVSYISDIKNGKANQKKSDFNLDGFVIQDHILLDIIEQFKTNSEESKKIFLTIIKNFFRGTVHPVHEICKDNNVQNLITVLCFDNEKHFHGFYNVTSIIRHFLSHNYSERVLLKKWDLNNDSTVTNLKKSYDKVLFNYDGKKYFSEAYGNRPFNIDILFDLSKIDIGVSLFDIISFKELFFLCELCNNSLFKAIREIKKYFYEKEGAE